MTSEYYHSLVAGDDGLRNWWVIGDFAVLARSLTGHSLAMEIGSGYQAGYSCRAASK